MAITYRTNDITRWGAGKGSPLASSEIDSNVWQLFQMISGFSPIAPIGIQSFSVGGASFYVQMTDGTSFGPYPLPITQWGFRGPWAPSTSYFQSDVITNSNSVYLVLFPHNSSGTFDPNANDGSGHNYYGLLFQPPVAIPAGGTTGQALTKITNADFAIQWSDTGVPLGGASGQILSKTSGADFDTHWADAPSALPTAGPTYTVLTKNSGTTGDVSWLYPPFTQIGNGFAGPQNVALTDLWQIQHCYGGTITIPDDGTVAFPDGAFIFCFNGANGPTTFVGATTGAGVTLAPFGRTSFVLEDEGDRAWLLKQSTNLWYICGDLNPISQSLASGTISVDMTGGAVFTYAGVAAVTINASVVDSKRKTFIITTQGATSFNVTFGTNFKSQGALSMGTVAAKKFVVEFVGDGTTYYEVSRTTAM